MGTKQTPDEHWDREQMARDTEGVPEATPQGEVWNRRQMEIDDTGSDTETVERTGIDVGTPAGGLSGHGKPSGESHWDRVDRTDEDETAG